MARRWLWIGVVGVILFAINVASRLWIRIGPVDDLDTEELVQLYSLIAMALAMVIVAVLWGRRRPGGEVVADLAGAGALGILLTLVAGPFVSGGTPNDGGITDTMAQLGLLAAAIGGGALVGMCLLIMLGKDYRSKSLARFAEERLSKPQRVARS